MAGFYTRHGYRAHDHLFVGWDQTARALALLREL